MVKDLVKPTNDPNKKPLVLWSGGADSTYLLLHHFKHSVNVDVLALDCFQDRGKVFRELVARHRLRESFKQLYIVDGVSATSRESLYDANVYGIKQFSQLAAPYANRLAFSQATPWILGALLNFNPDQHSHIEIAYVLGDEISALLPVIHEVGRGLGLVMHGVPVDIYFPLMWTRKQSIYSGLNKYKADPYTTDTLLDLTWTCEIPTDAGHCGECPSCLKESQLRTSLSIKPRQPESLDIGIVDGGPHNTIERVGKFDSLFYSEWMERYIRAHPKTEE